MSWTNRFLLPQCRPMARRAIEMDQLMNPATVLPVSLLISSARLLIERHLGLARISGEISNFTRAASVHCYFVLKDSQAQVRCVIFPHRSQLVALLLNNTLPVDSRHTPTIYETHLHF